MLKDITIGQYVPGTSLVHRLDPRVKLYAVTLFIIAIFFVHRFVLYVPMAAFIFLVLVNAKISPKIVLKGLKPLIFIILLTILVNLFMTPGEVLGSFWIFTVTKEGVRQSLFMALRLILLMMGTSLLTLTTSPIQLTDGLEAVMKPLSRVGFPAHELAMMMTIALRFIPTLFEETDKIMKAQMARGADFESGNVLRRAKNLVPLLVPLFINSFRRADDLATAMEARCYRGGEGRTRLNELHFESRDRWAMLGLTLFFGMIIASRFLWP